MTEVPEQAFQISREGAHSHDGVQRSTPPHKGKGGACRVRLLFCTRHSPRISCYDLKGTLECWFGVGNIKIFWLDLPAGKKEDLV